MVTGPDKYLNIRPPNMKSFLYGPPKMVPLILGNSKPDTTPFFKGLPLIFGNPPFSRLKDCCLKRAA